VNSTWTITVEDPEGRIDTRTITVDDETDHTESTNTKVVMTLVGNMAKECVFLLRKQAANDEPDFRSEVAQDRVIRRIEARLDEIERLLRAESGRGVVIGTGPTIPVPIEPPLPPFPVGMDPTRPQQRSERS
jgi:hypothetical protein